MRKNTLLIVQTPSGAKVLAVDGACLPPAGCIVSDGNDRVVIDRWDYAAPTLARLAGGERVEIRFASGRDFSRGRDEE